MRCAPSLSKRTRFRRNVLRAEYCAGENQTSSNLFCYNSRKHQDFGSENRLHPLGDGLLILQNSLAVPSSPLAGPMLQVITYIAINYSNKAIMFDSAVASIFKQQLTA